MASIYQVRETMTYFNIVKFAWLPLHCGLGLHVPSVDARGAVLYGHPILRSTCCISLKFPALCLHDLRMVALEIGALGAKVATSTTVVSVWITDSSIGE